MPRKNLAARMGGWSAHHRWLALGLWFAFVIAAIVGGAITGQVNLKESQLGDGEAGHAARVIDNAGFKDRAGEMILITYPGHTVDDPGFRARRRPGRGSRQHLPAGHQRPQPAGLRATPAR